MFVEVALVNSPDSPESPIFQCPLAWRRGKDKINLTEKTAVVISFLKPATDVAKDRRAGTERPAVGNEKPAIYSTKVVNHASN